MSELDWEILERGDAAVDELRRFEGERYSSWQGAWDGLPADAKDPFTHPVWTISWFAELAGPQVRLFLLREDGRVVSGVPFRVVPRLGRCGLIHDDDYVIEGASIAGRPELVETAFARLFETKVPGAGKPLGIRLAKVDGSHALVAGSRAVVSTRGARSTLDVADGWETLHEGLSKNFKGNLRKSRNRLEKLGEVSVETLTDVEGLRDGLRRLAALEARSWKGREGSSIEDNAALGNFLAATLPGFAARGEALVQCLRVGDDDVAAQLCLHLDETLHVLKIGYDESQARLSPGNLLLERAIRDSCPALGVTRVSLVTLQPWHDKWKPDYRSTHSLQWFAPGVAGVLARATEVSVRDRVKRFLVARGWRRPITIP